MIRIFIYKHPHNHYLIWICSLAVDMNNTDEASLYCRCLEIITSSPHKMLKMQTMCSSSFSWKEQCLTVPRVLLRPTSFVNRDVACWMWCSRLRASCRLWLPFIASLHYINPPKLAISHQKELDKSCQNNKGAEYYCLSSCWICSWYDDSLSNGIVTQITTPSLLPSHEWIPRVKVAPANHTLPSTMWKVRWQLAKRWGEWRG